jgi:hypothetical protein
MTAAQVIQKLRDAGVELEIVDGELEVVSDDNITPEQMEFLTQHQDSIIVELTRTAELRETAEIRISRELRRLADDCLDFYAADLDVIAEMGDDDLEKMLVDYISKQDWYRRGLIEEPRPGEPIKLTGDSARD